MAGFPEPETGLVISYSYLWKEDEKQGQTEGRKDRPCAIVLAVDDPDPKADGRTQVAVAPITHSPPHDPNVAVEIPLAFISPDPPDYPSLRDLRDGRASAWLVWPLVVTVTGYSVLGSVADSVSS